MLQVEVVCVVTPFSFVIRYQRFEGLSFLHVQGEDLQLEYGSSMVLRNSGILSQHYAMSQHR